MHRGRRAVMPHPRIAPPARRERRGGHSVAKRGDEAHPDRLRSSSSSLRLPMHDEPRGEGCALCVSRCTAATSSGPMPAGSPDGHRDRRGGRPCAAPKAAAPSRPTGPRIAAHRPEAAPHAPMSARRGRASPICACSEAGAAPAAERRIPKAQSSGCSASIAPVCWTECAERQCVASCGRTPETDRGPPR